MARKLPDWLTEFVASSEWGEAPQYMYFWVGVATVAAALRRQVWIDQKTFIWYPNLYTLIVAPPGVVQKSTTADLGMRLLQKVPGMHFSSSTITWQALYDAFSLVGSEFEYGGELYTQYPLIINSSEFGTTLNPRDTEMIDQLVHIWDGRRMSKQTRKDGQITIDTPCLNLIACTTPDWIAENVPQYLIGGGLTSRMLFVYAEEKARLLAYPEDAVPKNYRQRQDILIEDLEQISQLRGEFHLTPDAKEWGVEWYKHFHTVESKQIDKTLLGGYIARKQTLTHKVAMCLSASMGDTLIITKEMLQRAVALVTELEKFMPHVYSKIGMEAGASAAQQVLAFLDRHNGRCKFEMLYRYMHKKYPNPEDFETVLIGMMDARYITINRDTREVIKL